LPTKTLHATYFPHTCHMLRPSHSFLFDSPNNTVRCNYIS
jgi:hypothetical protein